MKGQIIFYLFLCFAYTGYTQDCVFEGYYKTQSVYPQNASAFWFPDLTEVQGVANDGENWFITTTKFSNLWGDSAEEGELWRIPKSVDLSATSTPSNVISVKMSEVPELAVPTYWHWGDPDHFRYNNEDYILVPMYASNSTDGVIACFRADDLEFRSYSEIDQGPGWCAVDNDGYIYVTKDGNELVKYEVDWAQLTSLGADPDALSNPEVIELEFPGADYTSLKTIQGGEFSESGQLFYLVSGGAGGCVPIPGDGCGAFERHVGPGSPQASDGIHVFETANWTEIETSVNSSDPNVHFSFRFDNDLTGQQPQGLTIWDLEDGSAAGPIDGKLHVFIFDYDFDILDPGDHQFSMYHFTNIVYVDADEGVEPPASNIGSKMKPFKFFNDAFFYFPIWDGAEIRLRNGVYPDTGTYDKNVKITSEGGSAIIGQ